MVVIQGDISDKEHKVQRVEAEGNEFLMDYNTIKAVNMSYFQKHANKNSHEP